MVKHVNQFPSDTECMRFIATISDKELLKKCHQCMEIIVKAKDRQAAEANKNASILLEELESEKVKDFEGYSEEILLVNHFTPKTPHGIDITIGSSICRLGDGMGF